MSDEFAAQDWLGAEGDLNRRFMIYVPSKTKEGREIDGLTEAVGKITATLRERFGGATSYPATGYFGEHEEQILVIESYCRHEDWLASSHCLYTMVKGLAGNLQQEAIACSLDGKMALVKPG